MKPIFLNKSTVKLRGVNLGAWLVLEKWMTPSLFEGLAAEDETTWCVELGAKAEAILKQHWRTFITRDDFAWLASIGINAVRIPVGYWLFAADYPYHAKFANSRYPFVTGGLEILDQAFTWAEEFGLLIVLDLHTAPGCQNGFDNGGLKDVCEWHTQAEYQDYAVSVLARLAERYGHNPALYAIELLNEPRWDIPSDILLNFSQSAYSAIRQSCPASQVAVIMHDAFRKYDQFASVLSNPVYENFGLDIHRYQCFLQEDVDTDIFGHIAKTVVDWRQEADDIIQHTGGKTYVGEWSLGLNPKFLESWATQALNAESKAMDNFQQHCAYKAYAAAQLLCFEKYQGWFFWSYKTETMPQWSFRDCVEQGWMPPRF